MNEFYVPNKGTYAGRHKYIGKSVKYSSLQSIYFTASSLVKFPPKGINWVHNINLHKCVLESWGELEN